MIVGIHQPHFWPWMGYLNKIASSDLFVLLDEVQLEKGSFMYRNRILNPIEGKDPIYLTIPCERHGYLEKKFAEIEVKNQDNWKKKHLDSIKTTYKKSPFFKEVFPLVESFYSLEKKYVNDYAIESITFLLDLFEIKTKILKQSEISIPENDGKNDLVLSICKTVGADTYLSGNGARKYNEEETYRNAQIELRYQNFSFPEYWQMNKQQFTPGLSILDTLFCNGVNEAKNMFWSSVKEVRE